MYTLVFTEDAKKDLKELSKKGEIREDKYSDVKVMNHRYRNSFLEKRKAGASDGGMSRRGVYISFTI